MNSFKQLEFDKIKNSIKEYSHCTYNHKKIDSIVPLEDFEEINYRLHFTEEIQHLSSEGFRFNYENIDSVEEIINSPSTLTFNFEEFFKIYKIVQISNYIRSRTVDADPKTLNWQMSYKNKFKLFDSHVSKINFLPEIQKRFNEIFSEEGEILDSASLKLKSIRKSFSTIKNNIFKQLNSYLNNNSYEAFIQDKVITVRDNRYVILLKEGSQSVVKGIFHGHSSSGSSLFLEPTDTVDLNNKLAKAKEEEKQEVHKILTDFSELVLSFKKEIIQNQELLFQLDFFTSIANFSKSIDGKVPKIKYEKEIKLINARHPLLIRTFDKIESVIPFDLEIGRDFKILILSGPNTGGKTVTMKTVGLLTIMALSGIPISADENSEIGMFKNFLSDIGDEQSLENSLSTFSSHIKNIQKMLETGEESSLIFIDEIGASTDPEQGSALGLVILEELIARKVVGIITTHFTNLKIFAENNSSCLNASMEFNLDKHIPTYKLNRGFPGNSFAFEISQRLGLDEKILSKAKSIATKQNIELTELLLKLSEEKKRLSQISYQQKLKTKILDQRIKELEEKKRDLDENLRAIKKKGISEARDYLTNLQKEFNKELDYIKKIESSERKKEINKIAHKASKTSIQLKDSLEKLTITNLDALKKPEIGKNVWVKDFEENGEIIEINKDSIKVSLNGFTLTTELENLYEVPESKSNKKYVNTVQKPLIEKSYKLELKLIGKTFDESIPLLRDFIDDAYLAGLELLRIVHGKGTGILRQKIRNYLSKDSRVVDFWSPPPEAGGDGVTIVNIK